MLLLLRLPTRTNTGQSMMNPWYVFLGNVLVVAGLGLALWLFGCWWTDLDNKPAEWWARQTRL